MSRQKLTHTVQGLNSETAYIEMMSASIKIGRIFGIPIYLHFTFLIILLLFIYVFGSQSLTLMGITLGFGDIDASVGVKYVLGTIASVVFFATILAHELAHSYVAMRFGVKIRSITLMIFGGVASMEEIPKKPMEELKMALAGPMTSLAIGAMSYGLMVSLDLLELGSGLEGVVILLGIIAFYNVLLAFFNMLPAFPMDGGRVLRSFLAARMSYIDATKKAVSVAKVLAIGMAVFGIFVFNLFLVLIALFVYMGAKEEERATVISESLEGMTVRQIMSDAVQVAHPDMTVQQLLDLMMATRRMGYPVVDYGLVGIVTLSDTSKVQKDRIHITRVKDIMTRNVVTVKPETSAVEAVRILSQRDLGRLPVVDDRGMLVGIVTRKDFLRMVEIIEARRKGAISVIWGQPGWDQQRKPPQQPPHPPQY